MQTNAVRAPHGRTIFTTRHVNYGWHRLAQVPVDLPKRVQRRLGDLWTAQ